MAHKNKQNQNQGTNVPPPNEGGANNASKLANLATLLKEMNVGGEAAGQILQTVIGGAAKVVASHPGISTRIAGVGTGASGIQDVKSFVTGQDRSAGTLLKGIAKTALGAGLLIYNESEWYEQCGKPEISRNMKRPMDPVYLTDITENATLFGMGKVVDLHVEWKNYQDSLAFQTAMFEFYKMIRNSMNGRNLPYSQEKLNHFVVDTIAILTYLCQVMRQLSFINYNPEECPSFRYLWNKIANSTDGYGPVYLHELDEYVADQEHPEDSKLADTISYYEIMISAIEGTLVVPNFIGKFIGHYFGNVFRSDKDGSNTQYITLRIKDMPICRYDEYGNFIEYSTLDMTDLSLSGFTSLIRNYQTMYGMLAADLGRLELFTQVQFPMYKDLTHVAVYDEGLIQSLINAYTDSSAVVDRYLRLDQIPGTQDEFTQFLFLGAVQDELSPASPLHTPVFRVLSMIVKYVSNGALEWGNDLSQGDFDFSSDFGIALKTHIASDVFVNVNTDNTSQPLTDDQINTLTGATGITLSLGSSSSSRNTYESINYDITRTGSEGEYEYVMTYLGTNEYGQINHEGSDYLYTIIPISYLQPFGGGERMIFGQLAAVTNGSPAFTKDVLIQLDNLMPSGTSSLDQTVIAAGITAGNPILITSNISTLPQLVTYLTSLDCSIVDATQGIVTVNSYMPSNKRVNGYSFNVANETFDFENLTLGLIPDGNYEIRICDNGAANVSFRYAYADMVTEGGVAITKSFASLVPFMADQLDFHIPFTFTQNIHAVVNGVETSVESTQLALIKENYIPYLYDTRELPALLYKMFRSLFIGKKAFEVVA